MRSFDDSHTGFSTALRGASVAASPGPPSVTYWSISACHAHESFPGTALDYSVGFSLLGSDAATSISEEPGARKRHAGICAGAVRATGRPTAMAATQSDMMLPDNI